MSAGSKGGGTSREAGRRRARVTPFATLASIVVLGAALLVAFFAGPATAAGATYFVAPAGSGSDCAANSQASPFATIQAALACAAGGDAIELAPSGGTPYPGIGAIADNVTIEGAGARSVTIDVSGTGGLLTGQMKVEPGAAVTLRGATVDCVTDCGPVFSGVTNEGDLTLDGDLVTGAHTLRPAITNEGGASLTVLDSTIAGNHIGATNTAAGILNQVGAVARIANSTIADNSVTGGFAGGILNENPTAGSVTLTNDTITGNHAVGTSSAGGVVSSGAQPSIEAENTIIAGNSAKNGAPDCMGSLGDAPGGHNILGDGTGCPGIADNVDGDQVGVDAGLLALADNGGPTDTVALQAASPALDAAGTATCQAPPISGLDQRGAARDGAAGCDVGAYDSGGGGGIVNATYFVAPAGSGSDCAANSQASPFATIQAALACAAGGDAIALAPSGGTPYPGVGEIDDNVTIEGAGARSVTIDVSGTEPTLTDQMGVAASAAVTLRGATVDCVPTCGFFFSAVTNEGDLTLDGDLVTGADNVRPAITNKDGASLTVLDSTIAGNHIGGNNTAAGILNQFGATARIANSTIADNAIDNGFAGGILNENPTVGAVTLTNDTITGNHAVGESSAGGVVSTGTPSIEAENTIIAGNSAENGSPDCMGVLGDAPGGHNILGDGTGCSGIADGEHGDQVDVPHPGLLALADNGGPTDTVALEAGSPALAEADTDTCQAPPISGLDQRGAPRDGATGCDVGAYEAAPLLTTTASAAVVIGGSVSDTATLVGGLSPTGAVIFKLYGPDDSSCGGVPVFVSGPVPVEGNGSYASGSFVPAHAGTYRWIAEYPGDSDNDPVAGPCNDAGESVAVAKAGPSLAAGASAGVALGGSLHDTATLAGGHSPSGQITFRAYGPDDPSCSGAPAFTDATPVAGNGAYVSASFTPAHAGSYRWTASYSGDADNEPAAGACNAPGQAAKVLAPPKPSARPPKPPKHSVHPSNSFRLAKPVLNKRRGTATLAVFVSAPGKLRLAGKGIKGLVRKARRAGKVKLTVKPKGKASRRLRRTHRAKVRAIVTYTPTGGEPRKKAEVVRLVKRQGGVRRSRPT